MFREFIYQPIFNLTVALYNVIPGADLGLAIIAMTVLIRLLLSPLSRKALVLQKKMSALTPKMNEIKQKHKGDQKAQSEALTHLYRQEGVNPLWGCLPLLIQIPIILALYEVFSAVSVGKDLDLLYGFISKPEVINATLLGLVNLAKPQHFMAVLAGVFQFIQAKQTIQKPEKGAAPQEGFAGAMNTQMLYFFPGMIVIISWNFPAGITLYWVTTTLFSIGEQLYVRRKLPVKTV